MGSRLELHEILVKLIDKTEPDGDTHVYFQPPQSIKMKYPAIKYSINDIDNRYADNVVYNQSRSYQLIVIDKDPDSEIVDKVSKLPMCSFDRFYTSDNLNHTVFKIYF